MIGGVARGNSGMDTKSCPIVILNGMKPSAAMYGVVVSYLSKWQEVRLIVLMIIDVTSQV